MVKVMAVNAGSSSLKFQLINMPSEEVITLGLVERIGQEVGNFVIKVNGEKISSPYVINAIGNSDYLKSAVSGKGGGVDELKELGHETSVNTNKKIKIEKYEKDMNTKYIN